MDQTTQKTIEDALHASVNNTQTFPETVAALMGVGVSRYHVDYTRGEKTCYLRNGESHVMSIDLDFRHSAEQFDAAEVAAAVLASQTEGQPYPVFIERTLRAGCVGYFAYLDGRKVVYIGNFGEEHTEHFPS